MATSPSSIENNFTGLGGKVELTPPSGLGGGTKVAIADIISVKPGETKTDFIEKTVINGTSNKKKKAPTLSDDGEWTLDVNSNFDDPGQLLLAAAQLINARLIVDVTYPPLPGYTTGLKRTFGAYVSRNGAADMATTQLSQYPVGLMPDGTGYTDTPAVED